MTQTYRSSHEKFHTRDDHPNNDERPNLCAG